MSLRKYNRLRKKGYYTVGGTNWRSSDFGGTWVILLMSNGESYKKVKIKELGWVDGFMERESLYREIDEFTGKKIY